MWTSAILFGEFQEKEGKTTIETAVPPAWKCLSWKWSKSIYYYVQFVIGKILQAILPVAAANAGCWLTKPYILNLESLRNWLLSGETRKSASEWGSMQKPYVIHLCVCVSVCEIIHRNNTRIHWSGRKSKNLLNAKVKLRKINARHNVARRIVVYSGYTLFSYTTTAHVYNHLSAETKNQIQTEIRSVILPFSYVKVSKSISIRQVIYFTVSSFRSLFFFTGLSCSIFVVVVDSLFVRTVKRLHLLRQGHGKFLSSMPSQRICGNLAVEFSSTLSHENRKSFFFLQQQQKNTLDRNWLRLKSSKLIDYIPVIQYQFNIIQSRINH